MKFTNLHPSLARFWYPVARISDLDADPRRVTVGGRNYVLVRDESGAFALADRCPHRGAPLSAGTLDPGGTLRCPYHGYGFDRAGRCVSIPSQESTTPIPSKADCAAPWGVTEHLGLVWLAPEEPVRPLPTLGFPMLDGCEPLAAPPQTFAVAASLLVENALDQAHVPWVHGAALGSPADTSTVDVERDGWSFTATYHQSGVSDDEVFAHDTVRFRYEAPFVVSGLFEYGRDLAFGFVSAVTPIDKDNVVAYGVILAPAEASTALAGFLDAQEKITEEDRRMLELLPDDGLELDPRLEVHTSADRAGIELRRVLAEVAGAG